MRNISTTPDSSAANSPVIVFRRRRKPRSLPPMDRKGFSDTPVSQCSDGGISMIDLNQYSSFNNTPTTYISKRGISDHDYSSTPSKPNYPNSRLKRLRIKKQNERKKEESNQRRYISVTPPPRLVKYHDNFLQDWSQNSTPIHLVKSKSVSSLSRFNQESETPDLSKLLIDSNETIRYSQPEFTDSIMAGRNRKRKTVKVRYKPETNTNNRREQPQDKREVDTTGTESIESIKSDQHSPNTSMYDASNESETSTEEFLVRSPVCVNEIVVDRTNDTNIVNHETDIASTEKMVRNSDIKRVNFVETQRNNEDNSIRPIPKTWPRKTEPTVHNKQSLSREKILTEPTIEYSKEVKKKANNMLKSNSETQLPTIKPQNSSMVLQNGHIENDHFRYDYPKQNDHKEKSVHLPEITLVPNTNDSIKKRIPVRLNRMDTPPENELYNPLGLLAPTFTTFNGYSSDDDENMFTTYSKFSRPNTKRYQ